MSYELIYALIFPGMFAVTLFFLELGRRLRLKQAREGPEPERAGVEVVEGAIFGLMALLIAFTFSGAASRFEARRQIIVEEANAIGTAYLRLDLLPADKQPTLREKFRRYVDQQLATYRAIPNLEAFTAAYESSTQMQQAIWQEAIVSAMAAGGPAAIQLPGALNAMFDIATTRYMSTQFHTPLPILALLVFLTWFCALLAGFRMAGGKSRKWPHILIFATLMSMTIYTIIDFEFPRVGFINLEQYDSVLLDLRAGMK